MGDQSEVAAHCQPADDWPPKGDWHSTLEISLGAALWYPEWLQGLNLWAGPAVQQPTVVSELVVPLFPVEIVARAAWNVASLSVADVVLFFRPMGQEMWCLLVAQWLVWWTLLDAADIANIPARPWPSKWRPITAADNGRYRPRRYGYRPLFFSCPFFRCCTTDRTVFFSPILPSLFTANIHLRSSHCAHRPFFRVWLNDIVKCQPITKWEPIISEISSVRFAAA